MWELISVLHIGHLYTHLAHAGHVTWCWQGRKVTVGLCPMQILQQGSVPVRGAGALSEREEPERKVSSCFLSLLHLSAITLNLDFCFCTIATCSSNFS